MMTMQPNSLFSPVEGATRKDAGMASAAMAKKAVLETARGIAREIARNSPTRTVTADQVQAVLERRHGWDHSVLGPAAGSIFRGKEWRFTGRRVRSSSKRNHGRELKVW